MKLGPLYVFGVAAENSSERRSWDIFNIYGSLDSNAVAESELQCCLKYTASSQSFFLPAKFKYQRIKDHLRINATMLSFFFVCPNKKIFDRKIPTGVAVTRANTSCDESHVTYVPPHFPLKESKSMVAICTKAAYADINPELIIEWMEAYKYLGVNKVITYYLETINSEALKVLEYYKATGILELIFYEPANEGT